MRPRIYRKSTGQVSLVRSTRSTGDGEIATANKKLDLRIKVHTPVTKSMQSLNNLNTKFN